MSSSASTSHSHSSSTSTPSSPPDPPVNPPVTPPDDNGCTDNPVRYFNGEILLSTTDLSGALSGFRHRRSYSNKLESMYAGPNGNNWLIPDWPYLIKDTSSTGVDDTVVYVRGQNRVWFDRVGSAWTARYGLNDRYSIEHDQSNDVYTVTRTSGGGAQTYVLHGFDQTAKPQGFLKESTDAYGKKTSVISYEGQAIKEMHRLEGASGSETTWSLHYTFYPVGNDTGRIQHATIRKKGSGDLEWTNIRRAHYAYHSGELSYGSRNDLETVTVQFPDSSEPSGWGDASKTYYRWYKAGDTNGFEGGLKYVVGPAAYAEMLADGKTPESTGDISGYADHYFEYDSTTREVTKEVATNCAGCGGNNGTGSEGDSFERFKNNSLGSSPAYNEWAWRVELRKANNNFEVIYTNYLGQVLLEELRESEASGNKWITYTKYGESGGAIGKAIEVASPAAVTGYTEGTTTLSVDVKGDTGLITYTTYGDSTTADGETLGDAEGYPKEVSISEGDGGSNPPTKIKQRTTLYKTSGGSGGGVSIVPGKVTTYKTDAGTAADEIDTSYAYEWHTNLSNAMKQRTTTLPTVSANQGGTGATVTTKQYYDERGRMTFSQDERGIITESSYDPTTNLVTTLRVDVDTGPSGQSWAVVGNNEDVTTTYEYDDLGRQTQVLGQLHKANPDGSASKEIRHATWTVYKEGVSSDQTWTGRGYHEPGAVGQKNSLVNPVLVVCADKNGNTIDQVQSKRSSGTGRLSVSDTFARSDWSRWSTFVYNDIGLKIYERVYHAIPSSSSGLDGISGDYGSIHSNYEETSYGYDDKTNLLVRVLAPGGTVTRTVYDGINRVISTWVGLDADDGGANWRAWDHNTPGDMVKVTENVYDGGSSGGNSNLTQMTQYADGNTTRITSYGYDFRNRQTRTTDATGRVSESAYDNLNRVTATNWYSGIPGSGGTLFGKQESFYDDLGRVYQTKQYAVSNSGTPGNALIGESKHDKGGNVIESIAPGSGEAFTKNTYDNLNRMTRTYTGYDSGSGDVIVVEQETDYNKVGQVLSTTAKQRDTDTNPASPTFRETFTAGWYDGIGRPIASANYGATTTTRPDDVPTSADNRLVSTTSYNDAGEAYRSTDPEGIVTRLTFDQMGRMTKQSDNYKQAPTGDDESRETLYTYTADSLQETITAVLDRADPTNPVKNEVTTYAYQARLSNGSDLNANNLLTALQYPTDTATQRIDLKVNRLGQVIERSDQNDTVHQYEYDALGRQMTDRVTAFGTNGIDQAVRRIKTTYTTRGQVDTLTSYSQPTDGTAGNQAVNEVRFDYNDFNQLISDWQDHDGTVSAGSKRVQYAFASGASDANQIRQQTMTYPGGRTIGYSYGASGSGADKLNRVHALTEGVAGSNIVQYEYLGSGTPVRAVYPSADTRWDLWGGTPGSYTGLDTFNRISRVLWQTDVAATPNDAVDLLYGYDKNSLPTYRRDVIAHAASKGLDEIYGRDGLNRLGDYRRGQLNDGPNANTSISGATLTQEWTLGPVANWEAFNQGVTDPLTQTRTHNLSNEITGIFGGGWTTPQYDAAGNTTVLSKPASPTAGFEATYDAWNRLVALHDEATSTKVSAYAYDGRGFRVQKVEHDSAGLAESTTDYYYTTGWQCVEEVTAAPSSSPSSSFSSSGGTQQSVRTYVWGLRYVDDLVSRDTTPTGGATSTYYALSDRQFDVVALVGLVGGDWEVVERYIYTPYGTRTVMDENFVGKTGGTTYGQHRGFQGLLRDEESGLIENRERMLDSLTGRFLQRDPLGYPEGLNAYAAYHVMCGGLDPTGLSTTPSEATGPGPTQSVYVSASYTVYYYERSRVTAGRGRGNRTNNEWRIGNFEGFLRGRYQETPSGSGEYRFISTSLNADGTSARDPFYSDGTGIITNLTLSDKYRIEDNCHECIEGEIIYTAVITDDNTTATIGVGSSYTWRGITANVGASRGFSRGGGNEYVQRFILDLKVCTDGTTNKTLTKSGQLTIHNGDPRTWNTRGGQGGNIKRFHWRGIEAR